GHLVFAHHERRGLLRRTRLAIRLAGRGCRRGTRECAICRAVSGQRGVSFEKAYVMEGILSLASYLAAFMATGTFWFGVSHDAFLARVGAAGLATLGITLAESAERRMR